MWRFYSTKRGGGGGGGGGSSFSNAEGGEHNKFLGSFYVLAWSIRGGGGAKSVMYLFISGGAVQVLAMLKGVSTTSF